MTTKEFFAKHYGSLSIGAFSVGLLAVLAAFGDDIGALTKFNAKKPETAAPAPPPPPVINPPQQAESPPASDAAAEPELDPLEKALAEEAERSAQRAEAAGQQQVAAPPAEAPPPQAPADESSGSANAI